jgi:hypothetical protein
MSAFYLSHNLQSLNVLMNFISDEGILFQMSKFVVRFGIRIYSLYIICNFVQLILLCSYIFVVAELITLMLIR